MTVQKCPNCGKDWKPDERNFCLNCGYSGLPVVMEKARDVKELFELQAKLKEIPKENAASQ